MSSRCRVCDTPAREWETDDLDEHLESAHGDERWSIKAVYPDRYERLFDGDRSTGDPPDGPETGGDDGDESPPEPMPGFDDGETYSRKWFVIGVGGAGNHIVDAVLMRRDTLVKNNEDRARIWQGGLAGYGILNTNTKELADTYYAREEQGYSRNDILANAIIGFGEHDYTGMGHRWHYGERVAAADFEDGGNPFRDRWDIRPQNIRDAQAVMFVHSVTKGTGCGATPVIARKLREEVLASDKALDKALVSSVVIPSEGGHQSQFGGRAQTNGVVGLGRISREVDAIIPFNNDMLRAAEADISPRIDGLEEYNPPQYTDLNRPLVAFLEAFTMSSTPGLFDRDDEMSIRGDVFDVSDSFRLVEDKYPIDMDREYTPAVILAPALGRMRGSTVDESSLELLARNALFQNRLADFDATTAWGGNFMIYGPEEKMSEVSRYVTDGTMQRILNGEELLDGADTPGAETVDVQINQLIVPYLDDVFLWGTLWNPEMPALRSMYEHAASLKEGNSPRAENLREVWEYVDPLFSCLGRENMV